MEVSPITGKQAIKIVKALVYSFASGFIGTLTLVSLDFLRAAQGEEAAIVNLGIALVVAAVVGGINAVFVTIKQLLTPSPN